MPYAILSLGILQRGQRSVDESVLPMMHVILAIVENRTTTMTGLLSLPPELTHEIIQSVSYVAVCQPPYVFSMNF
jgi:hypothetical protein